MRKTITIIIMIMLILTTTVIATSKTTKQIQEEYEIPKEKVGVHDNIKQECRLYNPYTDYFLIQK